MYMALHIECRFNKNSLLQCYFLAILPAGNNKVNVFIRMKIRSIESPYSGHGLKRAGENCFCHQENLFLLKMLSVKYKADISMENNCVHTQVTFCKRSKNCLRNNNVFATITTVFCSYRSHGTTMVTSDGCNSRHSENYENMILTCLNFLLNGIQHCKLVNPVLRNRVVNSKKYSSTTFNLFRRYFPKF